MNRLLHHHGFYSALVLTALALLWHLGTQAGEWVARVMGR